MAWIVASWVQNQINMKINYKIRFRYYGSGYSYICHQTEARRVRRERWSWCWCWGLGLGNSRYQPDAFESTDSSGEIEPEMW